MKVIYDNGRVYSADEVAFGMGRYVVHDGETVVDVDNDIIALAKRHSIEPVPVNQPETQKNKS